jgi:hypothetical protein
MTAPQCASGAFGTMDPLVREYWYSKISEGLPVWHQPWRTTLNLGAGLFCGAISWLILRGTVKREDRRRLDTIGFLLCYGLLLSIFVFRTVSVATAYAVPVTAALVAILFKRYRQSKIAGRRVLLVAIMLALLVPGTVLSSIARLVPGEKAKTDHSAANDACQSALSVRALSDLPQGTFVAPFDMGPTILAQTRHGVLASSHHRNEQAMHDHIQIFRSAPDGARALMKARGIDYLAVCPQEAELGGYARKDPNGLWALIKNDNAPEWLEPLPDRGDGVKVWRMR